MRLAIEYRFERIDNTRPINRPICSFHVVIAYDCQSFEDTKSLRFFSEVSRMPRPDSASQVVSNVRATGARRRFLKIITKVQTRALNR